MTPTTLPRLNRIGLLILFVLSWLSFRPLSASAEPGATALEFLRLGQGARGVAVGGAYTAVVNDATAMFWNPAGLGFVRSPQLTFQNHHYIADISQNYLAGAFPTRNIGSFGFSANILNIGGIERTTLTSGQAGQVLGTFGARDMALDVGWGKELWYGVSFGATGRFITSRIADEEGTAITGDVGMQLRLLDNWWFGFAFKNYGTGIKYIHFEEPLPRSIRVGTALLLLSNRNLILSADFNKVRDDDFFINFGAEYTLLKHFSFRGGYTLENKDVNEGLTLGAGFRISIVDLDYAYVPFGILGNSQRVSLTIRIGKLMANRENNPTP